MPIPNDTSKQAEQILIEGYRSMSPARKIQQVVALTKTVQRLALTRIRHQYKTISTREEKLRLAALWLPKVSFSMSTEKTRINEVVAEFNDTLVGHGY